MSFSDDQFARHVFTYHSFKGCSLSGCLVQHSLKAAIAITLMAHKVNDYKYYNKIIKLIIISFRDTAMPAGG